MYLLDTNICIFAMKNTYPALSQKLFRILPSEIFVSSVTVGELEYGCYKSKWGERAKSIMNLFLAAYTIPHLPVSTFDIKPEVLLILTAKASWVSPK